VSELTVINGGLPDNSRERVGFRQKIMKAQDQMRDMIERGELRDCMNELTLTHYFAPIDETYGCCTYARQIFLPKGSVVIGKIHRHGHLNFLMRGKVSVSTEFGKKYLEAPSIFVSEPGLKRAVYAEEDSVWATVHLTKHSGEEFLKEIEDEVIAPDYETLGLMSSVKQLEGKL